jgi:hypothetical protein
VPWPEHFLWLEERLSFPPAVFGSPLKWGQILKERELEFKERKKEKKSSCTEVGFCPCSIGSVV